TVSSGRGHARTRRTTVSSGRGHARTRRTTVSSGRGHARTRRTTVSSGRGHARTRRTTMSSGGGHARTRRTTMSSGGGHARTRRFSPPFAGHLRRGGRVFILVEERAQALDDGLGDLLAVGLGRHELAVLLVTEVADFEEETGGDDVVADDGGHPFAAVAHDV